METKTIWDEAHCQAQMLNYYIMFDSCIFPTFEYIDELLKASFQDGINIGDDEYLEETVTNLNLDWSVIKKDLNTSKWKKVLNDNVNDMYQGNCWGVPSFKIADEDGSNPYYVWGQDRMWLLKEEINRRLTSPQAK